MSRREFLKGAAACGCLACLPGATASETKPRPRRYYCVYGAIDMSTDSPDLISLRNYGLTKLKDAKGTPNRAIVDYMEEEDKLLPLFFGSNTPKFLDPVRRNNAYTDFTYIDRTFIALGEGFVAEHASKMMLRVAAILAHEEGHAYQVRATVDQMLGDIKGYRVKYLELHADYMAGSYHAWREKHRPKAPAWSLDDFFAELPSSPPDYAKYHGSPQDRRKAFFEGRTDFPLLSKSSGAPADAAALQGLKYIQVLVRKGE